MFLAKKVRDHGDQLTAEIGFGNEALCANSGRLSGDETRIILADDDDISFRDVVPDNARRLDAIHARHGDVHQNQIRPKRTSLLDSLQAIDSLTADCPLRMRGQ